MSYLEQVEANLEAAIAEQQAGRATRAACEEAMRNAVLDYEERTRYAVTPDIALGTRKRVLNSGGRP